jgi:uncharacterized protein (TIGR02246 family)
VPIRDELQDFFDAMAAAYVAGDATACAGLFTADGQLHSPYAPPARGRAEIEALHRIWTEGATAKVFRVIDAGRSGDLAWALASYSEDDATIEGTSLCVFERGPDGHWLIRACSLNATDEP